MIFTFYSFKGGVGRSMAMANVAWELASRGLRVLAIDFDLEAPGLERYFDVPVGDVQACPGVIDLIEAFKRSLAGNGPMDEQAEFRRLAQFIHPRVADFGHGGRLDLMPAGRRASDDDKRSYALAVRTFDWQDFYFNWEGQAFFEWLRRSLIEGPDAPYDVVLADSRTGVTEMGGVCACQLADVVVMLCAPNHQNMAGTQDLADDLVSDAVQRLRPKRQPLRILVVPARVEQREPSLLDAFEQRFAATFGPHLPASLVALGVGYRELALPYVPKFAFEEQVTQERGVDSGELSQRYRFLSDVLLTLCEPATTAVLTQAASDARTRLAPASAATAPLDVGTAPVYDPTHRVAGIDAYLSCPRDARAVLQQLLAALAESGLRLRTEFGEAEAFGTDLDLPLTAREQLRHADALVLCADARGVRAWQRAEAKAARALPRPPALVRLLLPGAAEDAFALAFGDALNDGPLIDLRGWPSERASVWVLAEALKPRGRGAESMVGSAEMTTVSGAAAAAEIEPFPGVAPYAEQHFEFFGGRDEECAALVQLVTAQRRAVLHGPSGAGKTSLVRAALLPALRKASPAHPPRHVDLRGAASDVGWNTLRALPAEVLVVLDHADECDAPMQARLLDWWRADGGPRLLVVWRGAPLALAEAQMQARWQAESTAAMRDRQHPLHRSCDWGPTCGQIMGDAGGAHRLALAPIDATHLRDAVESVLAKVGRRAEPGLLERLFNDACPVPAATAVQRALLHLWQQQARGWLTNEAYDRVGGIDGLFMLELERALASAGRADATVALLLRMAGRSDEGLLTLLPMSWARAASQPAFGGAAAALVNGLVSRGLLDVRRDGGDALVSIAHRLRDWPGFDTLRQAQQAWHGDTIRIATGYADWIDKDVADGADALLGAPPTALVEAHLGRGEQLFAAARLREMRYRRIRRQRLVAVVAGTLFFAVGLAGYQSWSRGRAEAEAMRVEIEAQRAAAAQASQLEVERLRAQQQQRAPLASEVKAPASKGKVRVVAHRSGSRDNPTDEREARRLLAALPAKDFELAPRIEARDERVCGDVRLHHEEDIESAREATDLLNAAFAARPGDPRRLQLNDRRGVDAAATVARGTIEIWLPPLTDSTPEREHRWGASRLVPAGCAVVGSEVKARDELRRLLNAADQKAFSTELPLRREWIDGFYIGRTEVTAAAFAEYQRQCVQTPGSTCPPWKPRFLDPQTEGRRPATWVSWAQADAYCRWAGGRLPTDLEWEKAARGIDGRFWPWGDQLEGARFQGKTQAARRPVDVGSFPAGDSPYGVADMSGNVWEFTADRYDDDSHSMRGGSYLNTLMESRASVRWASSLEDKGADYLGFRCAVSVPR